MKAKQQTKKAPGFSRQIKKSSNGLRVKPTLPVGLQLCLSLSLVPYFLWASFPFFFLHIFLSQESIFSLIFLVLFGGPLLVFLSNYWIIQLLKKHQKSVWQFFITVGVISTLLLCVLEWFYISNALMRVLAGVVLLPLLGQVLVAGLVCINRKYFNGEVSLIRSIGMVLLGAVFAIVQMTIYISALLVAFFLLFPPVNI